MQMNRFQALRRNEKKSSSKKKDWFRKKKVGAKSSESVEQIMSEQYDKNQELPLTKRKIIKKFIGPKEINKFNRQQIVSFTDKIE